MRHDSSDYIRVNPEVFAHSCAFCGYACNCTWCACDYNKMSHPVWQCARIAGTEATCFTSKRSMEYFYHCQGTESADEMLEMPFIIVYSDLRLHHLGYSIPKVTHELCVTLVVRGGETEYC